MTCVVGIIENNKIYMGADSLASDSSFHAEPRKDEKIFHIDNFLIAYSNSYRVGQLIRYKMKIPKKDSSKDTFQFMVVDFVESLRYTLQEGGCQIINSNQQTCMDGELLIGFEKRLFIIDQDYQVGESELNFNSCGSGSSYALGSLFSTSTSKSPRYRINMALKAAQKFTCNVREPFILMEM